MQFDSGYPESILSGFLINVVYWRYQTRNDLLLIAARPNIFLDGSAVESNFPRGTNLPVYRRNDRLIRRMLYACFEYTLGVKCLRVSRELLRERIEDMLRDLK